MMLHIDLIRLYNDSVKQTIPNILSKDGSDCMATSFLWLDGSWLGFL